MRRGADFARRVVRGGHRPPVRPTLGGCATLALAAALTAVGGETASTALVAAAVAAAIALAAGLLAVLAARSVAGEAGAAASGAGDAAEDRRTAFPSPRLARLAHPARGPVRAIACAAFEVDRRCLWVKLDQRGRAVGSFEGDEAPTERGLYRTGSVAVRHRDLFGLWVSQRTLPSPDELWVAPEPYATGRAGAPRRRRAPGFTPADDRERAASLVRPYEKGDPLRAIAWRQSAHHGTLMSYERERSRLLVPLLAVDTLDAADADALAREAVTAAVDIAAQPGARDEVSLTDGVARAQGIRRAGRLCAALQPDPPENPADLAREAARRAGRIRAQAARAAGAAAMRPVVLVTEHPDGAMARALSEALGRDRIRIATVRPASAPEPAQGFDRRRAAGPVPDPGIRPRRRPALPDPSLAADAASACCSVAVLALTFHLATSLVQPVRWQVAGLIACSVAAVCAVLARRTPLGRTRIRRMALAAALLAVIAGALIACAAAGLRGAAGVRILDEGADLGVLGIDAAGGGLAWIVPVTLQGVFELYFGQWVPVTTSPVSDAALTLLMAPVALLAYALFSSRCARALAALPPLALLACRHVFMGAASDPIEVAAAIGLGLALRALAQGRPRGSRQAGPSGHPVGRRPAAVRARPACVRLGFAVGAAVCAACTALSLALAPQATAAASRLPINLGLQSNVLAGSTVNPFMDLRRDLARPRTTRALTYSVSEGGPVYLRMATLGDLSGATWPLEAATDAAGPLERLLGGGGADAATALPGESPDDPPLAAAARGGVPYERTGVRDVSVTVEIEGLATRFLPLPIGAYDTQTGGTDTREGDWRWGDDSSVCGGDSATSRGQVYSAQAIYLEPVTDATGFGRIGSLMGAVLSEDPSDQGDIASRLRAWDERVREDLDSPGARYLEVPAELPQTIRDVADAARDAGASSPDGAAEELGTGAETLMTELNALGYLVAYFSDARFTYDLDAPDGGGADNYGAVADFLETGRGYCLHYASAFAVLGRCLGVPTRIALGYRGTDARTGDGAFVATNRDLHAWTECYVHGLGWIPFDMTPSAGARSTAPGRSAPLAETPVQNPPAQDEPATETAEAPEADSGAQDLSDSDAADADTADGTRTDPLAAIGEAVARIAEAARRAAPMLGACAALACALAAPRLLRAVRRAGRMRSIRRASADPARAAEAAWAEALSAAGRAGAAWGAGATEEDVCRAVARAVPGAREGIGYLGRLVCRARYGMTPPQASPERVLDALREVERAAEDGRRRP